MKIKHFFIIALTVFSFAAQGQNPVQNLSNYLRNGMLDKAYENLNIAMGEERYTSDARTWLLRGNLYYAVFRAYELVNGIEIGMPDSTLRLLKGDPLNDFKKQKTPDGRANKWEWDLGFTVLILNNQVYSFNDPVNGVYKEIAPSRYEALKLARESYQECIKLDPRFQAEQTFPTNAYQGLNILSEGYYNAGVISFNQGDFKSSFNNFAESHNIKKFLKFREPSDTIPGFYAVRAASFYVRSLTEKGEYTEAKEVIEKAKTINPNDVDLALSEADMYLKTKDFVKTKSLLEEVIIKQPNDPQLYFVIGNIYDQLSKDTSYTKQEIEEYFDLTVKYYKKALDIKEDYFEALFNLGTIYNNQAVDLFTAAQKLIFGDPNYAGMVKKVDETFRTALPYLEKAHSINEADADPIRMLYSIYLRLKMDEKAIVFKKKMDSLKSE